MNDLEFEDPSESHGSGSESTEIKESAFLDPELSTMLAILGPAHTPMPEDVWARMQAAIGVESAARETGADAASNAAPLAPAGFQAADDSPAFTNSAEASSGAQPMPAAARATEDSGSAKVVSLADRVRTRSKFNFIAAAAVAAAAGGIWLLGGNHTGGTNPATNVAQGSSTDAQVRSGGITAATPSESVPTPADTKAAAKAKPVAVVAVSGKTYHRESLSTETQPLASGELQPSVNAKQVPPVFAKSAECVQAEVTRLAYEDPHTQVTADMGFMDGQPVAVLVEKNTADESAPPKVFIADSSGTCSLQYIDTASK